MRARKLLRIGTDMPILHIKSRWQLSFARRRRFATHFALYSLIIATCFTLALLMGSPSSWAADISVMVVDRNGRGIGEVVVTATPADSGVVSPSRTKDAVMDQRNLAFVPRVLVVAAGTSVEFPNNDIVSHQVYSFSAAKRFQLPLYKGQVHPPVTFDRPGLVVLGCNIHDVMVGYIYVTDAPYFGKTEPGGGIDLKNVRDGEYRIGIWSPYIADSPAALSRTIRVSGNESATIRLQLSQTLRPQPEPKPRRRDWEY
jgi:plastocyanin